MREESQSGWLKQLWNGEEEHNPANTHSRIFAIIFFERLAWYTLLSGLVLSLMQARGMSQAEASSMYGTFLSAAYLTPMFGGWIANRTSLRFCIALGIMVLASSYMIGAVGSAPGMMIGAAIGCGLFKPALSTLINVMYVKNDPRKQEAMSKYYSWVQLGALPTGVLAGWLHVSYGWPATYFVCSMATIISAIIVLTSWSKLVPFNSGIETLFQTKLDIVERDEEWHPRKIVAIMIGATLFWTAAHQQFSTLTFLAERMDRSTRWGVVPTEVFSSLNALFVFFFTFVLVRFSMSIKTKLVVSMLLAAASFAALLVGGSSMWALVASYAIGAAAELLTSPIGMSAVTDLVPRRWAAFGMSLVLLSSSIGGKLAGTLGGVNPFVAIKITIILALLGAGWYVLAWPEKEEEV